MVAQHRQAAVAFGGDPVELDDPPFSRKGPVAMPGIVGPFERQKRPFRRRDLHDRIIEVVGRLQEPQAAAGMFPGGVHVDEDRDDLALGVGMDASVPRAALAANRDRRRPPGEIEVELVFESVANLAHQFVEEFAERRP